MFKVEGCGRFEVKAKKVRAMKGIRKANLKWEVMLRQNLED